MQRPKMTNTLVERFPFTPEDKAKAQPVLWDGEVKGFGLRFSAKTGTRTYFIQFRVHGSNKERQVAIGRHNDPYRVEQARSKALAIKVKMLSGVDPVEEKQEAERERLDRENAASAQNVTLQACLDSYLENKRTKHGALRQATKDDMRRSIEKNLPDWLKEPIAGITRDRCLARFVELSKRAKSAANLTFVYLRSVCHYARDVYADEQGNYTVLATNPVTRMFKIQRLHQEKPRTRRIPLERVGHVWLALTQLRVDAKDRDDRTRADLVSLRMLTALRLTESGSLRWSQIDLTKKAIQLRSDVSKTHQDMTLPMSGALHALLTERAALPRVGPHAREYVFPSPKANAKLPYMKDPNATMKVVSGAANCAVSSHDFRRTLEDIARVVKVDPDDRRKLLVHAATDVHSKHYGNSPDPEALRPAVEAIAQFIVNAAKVAEAQATGANVVPLFGANTG